MMTGCGEGIGAALYTGGWELALMGLFVGLVGALLGFLGGAHYHNGHCGTVGR
jgi:hypothetical protein